MMSFPQEPVRILFLYDERDHDAFVQLEAHLSLLRREGLIDAWDQRRMLAGSPIEPELAGRLAAAHLVVPLLSARFFADDQRDALLRKSLAALPGRVLPVLLAPYERSADPTAGLEPLPGRDQPVSAFTDSDAAWAKVAAGLRLRAQAVRGPDALNAALSASRFAAPGDDLLTLAESFCLLRERLRGHSPEVLRRPGEPPFPIFLQVSYPDGGWVFSYGLATFAGTPDLAVVEQFHAGVHERCCRQNPYARSLLVYDGPLVSEALAQEAARRRIELRSLVQHCTPLDFQRYQERLARRLRSDKIYPVDLYVPPRLDRLLRDGRETTEDALRTMASWVRDAGRQMVVVLGDFGTGKTFLLRQLALALIEGGGPVPVLIELRNLEKARTLRALLAQHLADEGMDHNHEAFMAMLQAGQVALLFDGFDELALRVSYDRAVEHLDTVTQAVKGQARVILSSRTGHFRTAAQLETALSRQLSELAPVFAELQPFDPARVQAFLTQRLGDAAMQRYALIDAVKDLIGLASNPRMLGFILELEPAQLLAVKEQRGVISAAELYRLLIDRWLGYEHVRAHPRGVVAGLSVAQRRDAVEQLALRLWLLPERAVAGEELEPALREVLMGLTQGDLGTAAHQLGSGTLLTRDEQDRFSFIHQSVLEWLVARGAAAELRQGRDPAPLQHAEMSDLMADFLIDLAGVEKAAAWAHSAAVEVGMTGRRNRTRVLARLPAGSAGALNLSGQDLRGQDLSGLDLRRAVLENTDLSGKVLRGMDLRGARLRGARMVDVDLRGARIDGADLRDAQLLRADLRDADLLGAQLQGADLRAAKLLGVRGDPAELEKADLSGAARDGMPVRPVVISGAVKALAYSPDGAQLAVARDGQVLIYEADSGQVRHELLVHTGRVDSVAFSPGGEALAFGGFGGKVIVYDVRTGELRLELPGHARGVLCMAFSPEGEALAFGDDDGTVVVHDARTGELRLKLPGRIRLAYSLAFSPGGEALAYGGDDGTLVVRDARTGELRLKLPGYTRSVSGLAFSPGGEALASESDGKVVVHDARTGELRFNLSGHAIWGSSVAFSPGGETLAFVGENRKVVVHDARTGELRLELLGYARGMTSMAFSPGGEALAYGGFDGKVVVYDTRTGVQRYELSGHGRGVGSVAFSSGGEALAFARFDGKVVVHDARTGEFRLDLSGHSAAVISVAFSSEGEMLASGGRDGKVVVHDARTGELRLELSGHSAAVISVAFSPGGETLTSGDNYGVVIVHDTQTGERRHELSGHAGGVNSVAWSPRGKALACGGFDGKVILYDARTGERRHELSGHAGGVSSVAFSPGGEALACGGFAGKVILYDARTGEKRHELSGHSGSVNSVIFSPGGEALASGGDDGKVVVYDACTGMPRLTIATAPESWVAFFPDGSYRGQGDLAGLFFHQIGLCHFAPGELPALLLPLDQAPDQPGPDQQQPELPTKLPEPIAQVSLPATSPSGSSIERRSPDALLSPPPTPLASRARPVGWTFLVFGLLLCAYGLHTYLVLSAGTLLGLTGALLLFWPRRGQRP